MTANRTVTQKTADWYTAYDTIRRELTPQALRDIASMAKPDAGDAVIRLGVSMSRMVTANDRMAALVAGILTTTGGVKPLPLDANDEDTD